MSTTTWSSLLQHSDSDIHTIPEYCAIEKVSRAKIYNEWKNGEGVEFFRRGTKIFITEDARLRHREKLQRRAREERERSANSVSADADHTQHVAA